MIFLVTNFKIMKILIEELEDIICGYNASTAVKLVRIDNF